MFNVRQLLNLFHTKDMKILKKHEGFFMKILAYISLFLVAQDKPDIGR